MKYALAALFTASLAGAAPAQSDPPTGHERDPLVAAFLEGVVDRHLYCPETDGAEYLDSSATITWRGRGTERLPRIQGTTSLNFLTHQVRFDLQGETTRELEALSFEPITSVTTLAVKPSWIYQSYRIRLTHEDSEVRLDYEPVRAQEGTFPWTCWYSAEGLPLRSVQKKKNPLVEDRINEFKIAYKYDLVQGRRVLVEQTEEYQLATIKKTYEWAMTDGYLVLSRMTQSVAGRDLVVSFKNSVQPIKVKKSDSDDG